MRVISRHTNLQISNKKESEIVSKIVFLRDNIDHIDGKNCQILKTLSKSKNNEFHKINFEN